MDKKNIELKNNTDLELKNNNDIKDNHTKILHQSLIDEKKIRKNLITEFLVKMIDEFEDTKTKLSMDERFKKINLIFNYVVDNNYAELCESDRFIRVLINKYNSMVSDCKKYNKLDLFDYNKYKLYISKFDKNNLLK